MINYEKDSGKMSQDVWYINTLSQKIMEGKACHGKSPLQE
jgi:hypothetical protein